LVNQDIRKGYLLFRLFILQLLLEINTAGKRSIGSYSRRGCLQSGNAHEQSAVAAERYFSPRITGVWMQ